MPVPYNIDFELYILSKQSDDALQIVEQILPYFQPDYTVTINDNTDMGIKRDVPVILNSIAYEDDYQGDFASRRQLSTHFRLLLSFISMVLLRPVRLLRRCKLTSTQICLISHRRENRDIVSRLIQQRQMLMMILALVRQLHSSKMQKTSIPKQGVMNSN